MKLNRIDHISINVEDLPAAREFFLDLGFEVLGEGEMEGELLDRVVGLDNVKTALVMLGIPGGGTDIELVKYYTPVDEKGIQPNFPYTLGIRHIAIEVENIEAIIDKLKRRGSEIFSEIQNYENIYKLCYVRGPEGIILELAEKVK